MLKIKLARFGKRHQPEYRIVVNEAKDKRDGSYVALLGQYAPTHSPKILQLDLDAYNAWVKKGAQPTETVASLAKRAASKNPFPEKKPKLSKKAKIAQAAKSEKQPAVKESSEQSAESTSEPAQVNTPSANHEPADNDQPTKEEASN